MNTFKIIHVLREYTIPNHIEFDFDMYQSFSHIIQFASTWLTFRLYKISLRLLIVRVEVWRYWNANGKVCARKIVVFILKTPR